jgi:DDE superfamily endonuclease
MLHHSKAAVGDPVPQILRHWLGTWRTCFTAPSWEHVLVLVMGALLAPGKRTVSSCLRMTGRAQVANFASYHQILSRARWSSRAVARRLLGIVVERLVPDGPVVIGMDDTIERRWGRRINARGIYRDPVRSSHGHFVKASGLRWLSFMVLTPVSWTSLIKALPVLTLLAPSERSNHQRGRRHKLLTEWARQGALQLCRWLPGRQIIFVGDSSFAVHELAHAITPRATLISRLRLDANLFAPPAKRTSRTMGRPAQKGPARPKLKTLLSNTTTSWTRIIVSAWYGHAEGKALEITSDTALWYRPGTPVLPVRWVLVRDPDGKRAPQAFFSTDVTLEPADIIALYVRRWQIEVTFAETRAHLGVETQRQWTDNAIARTTPALLGLYSLISLCACDLLTSASIPYAAAWYRKTSLTFSDAIGAVRLQLWLGDINQHSPPHREPKNIPASRVVRMAQALCFAA